MRRKSRNTYSALGKHQRNQSGKGTLVCVCYVHPHDLAPVGVKHANRRGKGVKEGDSSPTSLDVNNGSKNIEANSRGTDGDQ